MTAIETEARIHRAADVLLAARRDHHWLAALPENARPHTLDEAWAVQDRIAAALGGHAAWKVGGPDATAEPGASPLPRSLMHASPARLLASDFHFVGIEGEIGFRFGRDLPPRAAPYSRDEALAAVASVHPIIEIVDSRYERFRERSALEQAADSANHGALVVGPAAPGVSASIDQTFVHAQIFVDGGLRVDKTGGNTAVDVQRLLTWLANHCAKRGTPLRAGDVVTSGSCTGLLEVTRGVRVEARIGGVGSAVLQLD